MSFPQPPEFPNNGQQPQQPTGNQPPPNFGPPPAYGQPGPAPAYPQGPPQYQQPAYGQQAPYGQPGYGQQGFGQQTFNQMPTDPSQAPLPGASMGQAMSRFFKKYATFSGRASRSEFWWVALAFMLISIIPQIMMYMGVSQAVKEISGQYGAYSFAEILELVAQGGSASETIDAAISSSGLYLVGSLILGLIGIITFIPSLALTWRRLHDSNKSGAMFFLSFIPFVGALILFVFYLLPSDPAGQRFDAVR